MKKTHYSTIVILALVAIATAGIVSAQTTTGSTTGRWSKYYEQKQKNLEQEKEKLSERKEKFASTTANMRTRLENREIHLASTTAKINARINEREDRLASSTARFEAQKIRLEDKFKTGTSNKIAKVVDTLGSAISRIKSIDERIVAYISKLKAKNIDTSKVETLLVDAQAKLATATQNVTTLQSSVDSVLSGSISTSTKATIKTKIANVQKSVKDAHAAYIKVTENLKSDVSNVATSTATTTQ